MLCHQFKITYMMGIPNIGQVSSFPELAKPFGLNNVTYMNIFFRGQERFGW